MDFYYVETWHDIDEEERERREHFVAAETPEDAFRVLEKKLDSFLHRGFRYRLSECLQEPMEALFEDFEHTQVEMRVRWILNNVRIEMTREGFCIAENRENIAPALMVALGEYSPLPGLYEKVQDVTDPEELIVYTREELEEFLSFCLHDGMRQCLRTTSAESADVVE